MAENKVYLDENNKLVVTTNNGRQDSNGTTTKIEGSFSIQAEDVVKLFALVNNTDVVYPFVGYVPVTDWFFHSDFRTMIVTHDGCVMEQVNNALKKIKEQEKTIKELRKENSTLNASLKEQKVNAASASERVKENIEKFNNSRYWWERKISIE